MKNYRVWVKDIALQSIVVEADDEKQARISAEKLLKDGPLDFEEGEATESFWEVSSVEQITD